MFFKYCGLMLVIYYFVIECINCIILVIGKKMRDVYLYELYFNLVLYFFFVVFCVKLVSVCIVVRLE